MEPIRNVRVEAFIKSLEHGFNEMAKEATAQERIMTNFDVIRQETLEKEGEEAMQRLRLIDRSTNEEIDFVHPELIQESVRHLQIFRDSLMEKLEACVHEKDGERKAQTIVLESVQSCFHSTVYHGFDVLVPSYLGSAIHIAGDNFAKKSLPKGSATRRGIQTGSVVPANRNSVEGWQQTMNELLAYCDLAVDADMDLYHLTQAHLKRHHEAYPDQPLYDAHSPFEMVTQRYAAQQNDPKVGGPKEASLEEITNAVITQLTEIIAPFHEALPQTVGPELAWFIGRSAEVIQRREEGAPPPKFTLPPKSNGQIVVTSGGKTAPVGICGESASIAHLSAHRSPVAANDNVRHVVDILSDPASQQEIVQMVASVLRTPRHENASTDIHSLLDAKATFAQRYNLPSYAYHGPER